MRQTEVWRSMQNAFGTLIRTNATLLYFPYSKEYKQPSGAVTVFRKVVINFPVKDKFFVHKVEMVIRKGGTSRRICLNYDGKLKDNEKYSNFKCEFQLEHTGNYFYRFEIFLDNKILFVGKDVNGQAIAGDNLPEWQLTVYSDSFCTPEKFKGGTIYHIFADRFYKAGNALINPPYGTVKNWDEDVTIEDSDGIYRANDFYGGNLNGITEKLEYLKALGITCIYLSPIFESNSNHRYDTADYMKIDRTLGLEEDFIKLAQTAKEKGMSIILDGVFNHTGADSVYFNKFNHYESLGAYNSKESPYYDWYTFHKYPDNYDCWWGITVVPTIRRNCNSYQNMIAGKGGVIEKWQEEGAGGWRLDVVDELSEQFVKKIRKKVKSVNNDALIIGEVWEDASNKWSYSEEREYFLGEELDGVMNYVFKNAILNYVKDADAAKFINQVNQIIDHYPKECMDVCMTLLDSHDTFRAINALADVDTNEMTKRQKLDYKLSPVQYSAAKAKLKLASSIQYFLPGIPSLYYGDEIGMEGFDDPINRRPFCWNKMDYDLLAHYKYLGQLRNKFCDNFKDNAIITQYKNMIKIDRGGLILIANPAKEKNLDKEYFDILRNKNVQKLSQYEFLICKF